MKKQILTIIGSAAAEGFPGIFCTCETCQKAWANGGKDLRLPAAYKLNDRVRIDFGPDSIAQDQRFHLHTERVEHLIFTHSHEDHLYEPALTYRGGYFSRPFQHKNMKLYGSCGTINRLGDFMEKCGYLHGGAATMKTDLVTVRAFEPFEIPDEDMTFYPLTANHMAGDDPRYACPLFFAIRSGEKHLLIANDTGYFSEPVWEYLAKLDFQFDLVIADGTCGKVDVRDGHMGGKWCVELKTRLTKMGKLSPSCRYFLNHFSHNGGLVHSELEAMFGPHGMEIGFDGAEIEY